MQRFIKAREAWPIGRGLRLILLVQVVVAVFLILTDIEARWRFGLPPGADEPGGPVSPGDQVRRYDPTRPVPRFAPPGTRPGIELPDDLPPRLEFSLREDGDGGSFILLNGSIERGDADRFEAFLADFDEPPGPIALNSPGGLVGEALAIGQIVRDRAFGTLILPGMACLSACPYILAGGTERRVSLTGAVGLHQHYYETPGYMPVYFAVEDIQRSQGETMAYLIAMGVDPGVMVHGLMTPPHDIYILVEEELLESGFATEVTD